MLTLDGVRPSGRSDGCPRSPRLLPRLLKLCASGHENIQVGGLHIAARGPWPLRELDVARPLHRAVAAAVPAAASTAVPDGKPTRSAGPPAARAPEAARQQERYGAQRIAARHRDHHPSHRPGDDLRDAPACHTPGICHLARSVVRAPGTAMAAGLEPMAPYPKFLMAALTMRFVAGHGGRWEARAASAGDADGGRLWYGTHLPTCRGIQSGYAPLCADLILGYSGRRS
jgi:hypothetical protein